MIQLNDLIFKMMSILQSSLDEEWKWQKLEEIALQSASTKPVMFFKPYRSLFTSQMPTSESPLSVQGGCGLNHLMHFIHTITLIFSAYFQSQSK